MIQIMSNFVNLDKFFHGKRYKAEWCNSPIILRWLEKPTMSESLKIIDEKVGYLLSQSGGIFKLKEWFLSDDKHLVTTTAERYILDYLRKLNPTMNDILTGNDVDASIEISGQDYGIEVTCFLDTIAEWILIERIQQYIEQNKIILTSGLRISANLQALQKFSYLTKSEQCAVIAELSSHIEGPNTFSFQGITITKNSSPNPGIISWEFEQDGYDPFNDLLKDLSNKIITKSLQLNKRKNNILFVSVGSMPTNWLFPSIFSEIKTPNRWKNEVADLEKKVLEIIDGTSVKGVCFFVYSLHKAVPFYPLKLITSDQNLAVVL